MTNHQTSYNIAIILFATLGSLTYGYSTSIIATTLGQPTFKQYFDLLDAASSSAITGGLNGLYQAGGLFGVLSTAWASDRYGRKVSIGAYSIISILGGALQAGSVHIGMLMTARAITGLGIVIINARHEEALGILQKLHGDAAPESEDYVQQEFSTIRDQIEADSAHPTSWASLFKVRSYRKRLLVGFGTMFGAQCTGTQVINNYGPSLYASLGFSETNQLILAASWISFGVLCNYLNAKLLDWIGRRLCMGK
ncbi:High-affinity glucose transporter [Colletotrichum higginsianum IMI 349063]|uniref:High-affinity glucose transporter n=1 Tax=Colletotrichum higginsianum (strain IMI 349063) TaxID=759273 RepID=A0A1B7YSQ5_COLHI|nr:High-affinity glucose transporter [Colletotrichum higginsianum IMI 349063]OBR15061.1 High-affinity glucose transporter [Colletotrichum higginsianum IMI 349063]GJC92665.1 high-affinity glucose transporter [Colletotrichum higginsianum]